MNNYTEFSTKSVDAAYINSLVDLVNACRYRHVEIDKVCHFQNGWHITFVGHPHADAVCHDGSYGSPCSFWLPDGGHNNDWSRSGSWETIGFPWDYDDVSVHTAEELAFYLWALDNGKTPWEENENH